MPRYDFRCTACKTVFERTLPMSEAGSMQECPACGAAAKRKYHPVRRAWENPNDTGIDHRSMSEQEVEDALFSQITETED